MSLHAVANDLWLVEGPLVDFHGFPYPTRSVIVRLPGGALWIWSPVHLTEGLRREVEALGTIAHLVSPNKLHHLSLSDWHAAYPDAKLWGLPSTLARRRDLAFAGVLGGTPRKTGPG
ncbi:DUF4336 domain-containing protein [Halomonas nitroreducens]|uniref:DUF4336 domain-containing protein n=1 Tax=Halomonas nitroreducens TaxID=447425 RepID=UPI001FE5AAFC|nr:DUF4336 domain-containing protein [Halomonas nitroreducens]